MAAGAEPAEDMKHGGPMLAELSPTALLRGVALGGQSILGSGGPGAGLFQEGSAESPSAAASTLKSGIMAFNTFLDGGISGAASMMPTGLGGWPGAAGSAADSHLMPWADGIGDEFKHWLQYTKGVTREVAVAYTKRMEKLLRSLMDKRAAEGRPVGMELEKGDLMELIEDQMEEADRLMRLESKRGFLPHFREYLGMPRQPEGLIPTHHQQQQQQQQQQPQLRVQGSGSSLGSSMNGAGPGGERVYGVSGLALIKQEEEGVWSREVREAYRRWLEKEKGLSRERFQEYTRLMHRVLTTVAEPSMRGLEVEAVKDLLKAEAARIEEAVRISKKRRYYDLFMEHLGIAPPPSAGAQGGAERGEAVHNISRFEHLWPVTFREEFLTWLEAEQGISRRSARTYAGAVLKLLSQVLERVQQRRQLEGLGEDEALAPPIELPELQHLLGPGSEDARELTVRDKKAQGYLAAFQQYLALVRLGPEEGAWLERHKANFLSRLRTGAMMHKKESYSVLFRLMPTLREAWALAGSEEELERRIKEQDPAMLAVLSAGGKDVPLHLYDYLLRRPAHAHTPSAAANANANNNNNSNTNGLSARQHSAGSTSTSHQQQHHQHREEVYGDSSASMQEEGGRGDRDTAAPALGRGANGSMRVASRRSFGRDFEYLGSDDEQDGNASEEYVDDGADLEPSDAELEGDSTAPEAEDSRPRARAHSGHGSEGGGLPWPAAHTGTPSLSMPISPFPRPSEPSPFGDVERVLRTTSGPGGDDWRTRYMQMRAARDKAVREGEEYRRKWQELKGANTRLRSRVRDLEEAAVLAEGGVGGATGTGHPAGNLARENVCLRERIAGLRKAYSLLLRSFALQAGAVGPGQSADEALDELDVDLDLLGLAPGKGVGHFPAASSLGAVLPVPQPLSISIGTKRGVSNGLGGLEEGAGEPKRRKASL